jgi:hypothetical protein
MPFNPNRPGMPDLNTDAKFVVLPADKAGISNFSGTDFGHAATLTDLLTQMDALGWSYVGNFARQKTLTPFVQEYFYAFRKTNQEVTDVNLPSSTENLPKENPSTVKRTGRKSNSRDSEGTRN